MASFFKNATQDDLGIANPVANGIGWVIGRGASQSGNFLRSLTHLGFTQDETGRKVYDAIWPTIAGGRLPLNVRFGLPDAAATGLRHHGRRRHGPQRLGRGAGGRRDLRRRDPTGQRGRRAGSRENRRRHR